MNMHLTYAGYSDVGRVREANEDRWFADPAQGIFIVSDGMGGGPAGGLASEVVVRTLPGLLRNRQKDLEEAGAAAADVISQILCQLSAQLTDQVHGELGLEGMGATVVLAAVRGNRAMIAHMGDSRAYLLRNRAFVQLTHDHSIVQLLVDNHEITPEQARDYPERGRLTRFVGMPGEPLPEVGPHELKDGDTLLLCTDGINTMLNDEEILRILMQYLNPNDACRALVDAANAAGGRDNATVLVISVADEPSSGMSAGSVRQDGVQVGET